MPPTSSARWCRAVAYCDEDHQNTDARWHAAIAARPAAQRGREADKGVPAKYAQRKAALSAEEWSNMFGERMLGAVRL